MRAAVSTSCLFPKPTEDALYDLCLLGVQTVEIQLNAPSECKPVFVNDLAALLSRFGVRCCAVQPWTSAAEGQMLFSRYPRRTADFIEEAKSVFFAAQRLGAQFYILHGAPSGSVRPEIYCERFQMLSEAGKAFGVTVTQGNVYRHESLSLRFLRDFCRILGDDARLTFDTREAVRAGIDIGEAVRLLGSRIVHLHLSDHGERGDSLRLGQGRFGIAPFLQSLREKGFDGTAVLELNRENFTAASELAEDCQRLDRIIKKQIHS